MLKTRKINYKTKMDKTADNEKVPLTGGACEAHPKDALGRKII